MKRKTRMALIMICCFLNLLMLCSCTGDPPVQSERITDPVRYGEVNVFVKDDLTKMLPLLPETLPDAANVLQYGYSYQCAILGDPNYSIKLVLHFTDESAYGIERSRLLQLSDSDTVRKQTEDSEQYYFGTTLQGLDILTDAQTQDGRQVRIQYVFFNPADLEIVYGIGLFFDGSQYDSELIDTWKTAAATEGPT